MAMTLSPARVSASARIEPVQPSPTMTASTGGNLRVIGPGPPQKAPLAAASSARRPFGAAWDAHRRQRIGLVVPLHPVAVVVARTREADHFPANHVAVAAIDRIGEEPLLRVLQQKIEELRSADAFKLQAAVFERADELVLVFVGERGEDLPGLCRAAMLVERGKCGPVLLGGCFRGLHSLLWRPVLERPSHVEALCAAIRAGKLPVDEYGTAGVLAAGEFRVGRDQPVDQRLDRGAFLGGEEFLAAGVRLGGRNTGRGMPWQFPGDA